MSEDRIFATIARVHISLGHIGQNITATHIIKEYYRIANEKINFLVKLYEICHRKAHSKSKDALKNIVSTRLSRRVQIDLIDITITSDEDFVWIYHMKNHFSKFHMLFPIINKKTPTVARKIHH